MDPNSNSSSKSFSNSNPHLISTQNDPLNSNSGFLSNEIQEFDHDDTPRPFIASSKNQNSKCSSLQSVLQDCIFEKGAFSYCYPQFDAYQKCVQWERESKDREELEERYQAYLKEEKEEKIEEKKNFWNFWK